MTESKLFSVVIPAYGGGELWKEAIRSVLMQDYPAIELIFADDATPGFDIKKVRTYIEENRRENLVRYVAVTLEKNVGTVRNMREAHEFCTGEYLTQIAADDAYCAENVLSRYTNALQAAEDDVLGVYAKSIVCDEELRPAGKCSFDTEQAAHMNNMSADEQFAKFSYTCCAHMGATAFKREKFLAAGDFDERFKLIEDWPYYINGVLQGYRFKFVDFDAIYYREGGVTSINYASPTKRICFADHLRLYERIILPQIVRIGLRDQIGVYRKYATERCDLESIYGKLSELSKAEMIKKNKRFIAYEVLFRLYWYRRELGTTIVISTATGVMLGMGAACVAGAVILGSSAMLRYKKRTMRKKWAERTK